MRPGRGIEPRPGTPRSGGGSRRKAGARSAHHRRAKGAHTEPLRGEQGDRREPSRGKHGASSGQARQDGRGGGAAEPQYVLHASLSRFARRRARLYIQKPPQGFGGI